MQFMRLLKNRIQQQRNLDIEKFSVAAAGFARGGGGGGGPGQPRQPAPLGGRDENSPGLGFQGALRSGGL